MPRKENKQADLSAVMDSSNVYDMDNVYWCKQGWAYRHYKTNDKTDALYWDEILVAGEALQLDGTPDASAPEFGALAPTFESGDGVSDIDIPEITLFDIELADLAVTSGVAVAATSALEGTDLAGATYQWSSDDSGAVFSAGTAASTDVTFSDEGTYSVSCSVTVAYGNSTDVVSASATQEDIIVVLA